MIPEIFTLNNGLKCVWAKTPGKVSYIGLAVNVGSRDDGLHHHGLAHFLEHTIFKGTVKRRPWQISCRMESVGGELNAYTSKEETMIYVTAPNGNTNRALELLSDIVKNSNFPEEELAKEKEVVIEEIFSYRDSPSDAVYDDFEEHLYAGSGLAHNILGSEESVRRLKAADCRRLLDTYYTPGNMVLYIVDGGELKDSVKKAQRYFGDFNHPDVVHKREIPKKCSIFDITIDKNNHQANTVMGTRLFSRLDSRRHALFLLNNYLGGPGLNSRLNRELRERRGWVYTVDSAVSLLSDSGSMAIYYGCDPDKVEKCADIIRHEVQKLADSSLSLKKLEAMKRQYCGQLILTTDHKESRAMALAKSILYFNEIHDISKATLNIMDVTAEQIRELAQLICTNGFSKLTFR